MLERLVADSSAFALERRNFDFLPDDQAAQWRQDFMSTRRARMAGPEKLIVELLNSCNLDCPMCRVGQYGPKLSRSLPLATLERILAETPSVRSVRLNGLGESTLLPDFCDYLGMLRGRSLAVELISNGSADLDIYGQVLSAGGHVLVSWDSTRRATFEKLRRPAHWETFRAKLDEIGRISAATPQGRLSLIFTLQKANVGELEPMVELAASVNAALQVNVAKLPAMEWVASNWARIAADAQAAASAAVRLGLRLYLPDQICGRKLPVIGLAETAAARCGAPWREVVIRWNGDVQACNMFNPYVYGNVHRASLASIWVNEFATLFRAKLNSSDPHPYCRDCAYISAAYT